MPIIKITWQGLVAIALSVGLLWACIIGERVTMHHALTERARVLRDIRTMRGRQRQEPVSAPIPAKLPLLTVTRG
jgi:hypothetical protein